MRSWQTDFLQALRVFRRKPAFTSLVLVMLTFGTAATTIVFTLVNGVLLRPLPYRDPSALVAVRGVLPKLSHLYPTVPVTAPIIGVLRERASSFEQTAGLQGQRFTLSGAGEPERLDAARVSWTLFPMLGVQPLKGRTFEADEDQPGRDDVVVIAESLWTRRFNRSPEVVGQTITLDQRPYRVVGVLPASFAFPKREELHHFVPFGERTEVWKPLALTAFEQAADGDWNYAVIARLKPGVTRAQAVTELNVLFADVDRARREPQGLRADAEPLHEVIVGSVRPTLLFLLASVTAVLVIVAVNLSNLLLVHATARRREIGIRTALGASAGQLFRLLLSESLLLTGLGGAAGLGLAILVTQGLLSRLPVDLPRLADVTVDARVWLAAVSITVAVSIVFTLVPAWWLLRTDPSDALHQDGRGLTESRATRRVRAWLVAAQVGLSVVLLTVAALLVQSLARVSQTERGFDTAQVLAVHISLPNWQYTTRDRRAAFYRAALDRLAGVPSVQSVGAISRLPLSGEQSVSPVILDDESGRAAERPLATFREVSPSYFSAIGIPLTRGYLFAHNGSPRPVVVISEGLAQRLWPAQDPIGKQFRRGNLNSPRLEVVGVVRDIRSVGLDRAPTLMVYTPYWQVASGDMSFVLRTSTPAASIIAGVKEAIWEIDPNVPVPDATSMDDVVRRSLALRRFRAWLMSGFALSALLLAVLGIVGVVTYAAVQRRTEIGLRLALGSSRRQVAWLVLRQGIVPVIGGLVAGLAGAIVLARMVRGLLFDVSPTDPATFVTVPLVLLAVSITACARPVLSGTRVDPATALRND